MQLTELLDHFDTKLVHSEKVTAAYLRQEIKSVTLDSRKVGPGALFIATQGATQASRNGHEFIRQAIERGAAAIMVDDINYANTASDVPLYVVNKGRIAVARLAERLHHYPSKHMTLCGVTGTNGKTTVTFLTAAIMRQSGKSSAVIGTLGAGHTKALKPTGYTTPEAEVLSELLHDLQNEGFEHVTMEISSHALATHRADGLSFKAAAFTNLSVDHLDFHADFEEYRSAKNRLFLELLAPDSPAILPEDHELIPKLKQIGRPLLTWGLSPHADIQALHVEQRPEGMAFELRIGSEQYKVQSKMFGEYNLSNMLCAAGLAHTSGVSLETIARGLGEALPPPGRFERVHCANMEGKPRVFVDFAHTPDALKRTLDALRQMTPRKLVVVFGCGGNRDKKKRAQMGQITSTHADLVYITDDNPRHEISASIIEDILSGIDHNQRDHCKVVPDRRQAIAQAIRAAQKGDIVLIAGKGHEETQQIGDQLIPFYDLSFAQSDLEEWQP